MKRLIPTLLLLCTVFISVHSENVASLVITHSAGTTTSYQLFTKPRVTFVGDSVKMTSATVTAEYPASDVFRFNYTMPTAIENISADSRMKSDGEYLIFSGKLKADQVKLYTTDGKEAPADFTETQNGIRLRLSTLQRGVYMININGRTTKFMKR